MTSRPVVGFVLFFLALSAVVAVIPLRPAFGSTGQPTLGVTNTDVFQPATFTPGAPYVNVTAGGDAAVVSGPVNGYFAIDLSGVTFSGSQFLLYLSQNGFAQISPGDVLYSGPIPFNVADLSNPTGWHAVHETNGTFYIGQTTGGEKVVTGPVPFNISSAYVTVKVYDGSSTAVSASSMDLRIQPSVSVSPTSGPAGSVVKATAGGFSPNRVVDLSYSYFFYSWNGDVVTHTGNWTTGLNTGAGFFSYSAPILDLKQAYNPKGGIQSTSHITLSVRQEHSPHLLLASTAFNEKTRVFTGVRSYTPSGAMLDFGNNPPGPYGNDSSPAGGNLNQPINAEVSGTLNIAGNNMPPNSPVQFYIGSSQVGSAMSNGTGYYNSTVSVPVLPTGTAVVKAVNNGVTYEFEIQLLPTLVLIPASGPVGTSVTAHAYDFPVNQRFFLYWHEHSLGDATWYQVANGTTGPDGMFNVTVTFVVPASYGGVHEVAASATEVAKSSPQAPAPSIAYASADVTASTTTTTTTSTTSTTSRSTTTSTSAASTSTTTTSTSTTTTTTSTSTTTSTTSSTTRTSASSTTSTSSRTTTSTIQTLTSIQTSPPTTTSPTSGTDYTYVYLVVGAIVVVIIAIAAWALRSKQR